MKSKIAIIIFLILFIFITGVKVDASPFKLDSIHYLVAGNLNQFESLSLEVDSRLDRINKLGFVAAYNGKGINLEGNWKINFLHHSKYSLNLALYAMLDLKDMGLDKGLGISGNGLYLNQNRYFWEVKYCFKPANAPWLYRGGVEFPLTKSSYLTLGVGNSIWQTNTHQLNLGIKVDL